MVGGAGVEYMKRSEGIGGTGGGGVYGRDASAWERERDGVSERGGIDAGVRDLPRVWERVGDNSVGVTPSVVASTRSWLTCERSWWASWDFWVYWDRYSNDVSVSTVRRTRNEKLTCLIKPKKKRNLSQKFFASGAA